MYGPLLVVMVVLVLKLDQWMTMAMVMARLRVTEMVSQALE